MTTNIGRVRVLTPYEERRIKRYEKEVRGRLCEVYGESLPRELDREVGYIVKEIYIQTRNDIVNYDI